ncbi:MAG TPA: chorismate synthase, partial [Myxococcota bacterium]
MARLRFLTAGESHGPMLTGILDGVPAGLVLDKAAIEHQLHRRRQGHGRSPRQLLEKDDVEIVGGVRYGRTTGAPIAMLLKNAEAARWADVLSVWPIAKPAARRTVPRPGHADLAGLQKYDLDDVRDILERASARETAMRVALSTIARQLLAQVGIEVGSDVIDIGGIGCDVVDVDGFGGVAGARDRADASPVRCLDDEAATRMVAAIDAAKKSGQTLGGRFVVRASGLPPGLGSHTQWDRRLSATLSAAVASIHAVKSVAVGAGDAYAHTPGKAAHDAFVVDDNGPRRTSNRAGGLEGGMTTGEELRLVATLKPFSTVPGGLPSFDLDTGAADTGLVERSDVCAVPAGAVVGEAMVCLALADALLDALGGDNMAELVEHVADRRRRAQRPRRT